MTYDQRQYYTTWRFIPHHATYIIILSIHNNPSDFLIIPHDPFYVRVCAHCVVCSKSVDDIIFIFSSQRWEVKGFLEVFQTYQFGAFS